MYVARLNTSDDAATRQEVCVVSRSEEVTRDVSGVDREVVVRCVAKRGVVKRLHAACRVTRRRE